MGRQQIARSEQLGLISCSPYQYASPKFACPFGGAPTRISPTRQYAGHGHQQLDSPEAIDRGIIQEELRLGTLRTIDIPHLQTTVPIHVLYRKNCYLTGASRTLLSAGVSNVKVLRAIGPMPPMRCPMSRRRRSPLD